MNVLVRGGYFAIGVLMNLFLTFSSKKQLTRLHITCKGTIEDEGYGMLQVRMSCMGSFDCDICQIEDYFDTKDLFCHPSSLLKKDLSA